MSLPSSLTRHCAADAPRGGFSLIEVILSIGILAIAIVSLLGLIGPTLGAVRTVLDQNAGVTAVSKMNTILDTTPFFNGTDVGTGSGATSPNGNSSVYSWIKNSTNTTPTIFFFFDELDTSTGIVTPQVSVSDGVSVPGNSTGTNFILNFTTLLEDAQGTNGTKILSGPVIAMSLSLSPMAQDVTHGGAFPTGENFYTAPASGIFPSSTLLPANPNGTPTIAGSGISYPEAYLPILVQVFAMPVDQLILGGTAGALTSPSLTNVLTDTNRIFSYTTAKLR